MNNRIIKRGGIQKKIISFVVLFVFLIVICSFLSRDYLYRTFYGMGLWLNDAEYDPLDLERQIIGLWGTDEVIDVMLGEFEVKDRKIKLYAKTVTIYGDTLFRLPYTFERYQSGFRLNKKLKFERAYKWKLKVGPYIKGVRDHFMNDVGLKNAKYVMTLIQDIQYVAGFFEVFGTYTKGKYPAHLDVKVKELSSYKWAPLESNVLDLAKKHYHKEIHIVEAVGDTWEWFPEYKDKIVYFSLDIKGRAAMRFIVKGSTDIGFIDYEMRNRYGYKDPWEISEDRVFIE